MKKILMIAVAAGFVATNALAQTTIAAPETEAESDSATTPTFPSTNRNRSQVQNMEDGWTYNGWNKK